VIWGLSSDRSTYILVVLRGNWEETVGMSKCDACRSRLPRDLEYWCPVCGAALGPYGCSWELGAPAPSLADVSVEPAVEIGVVSSRDIEARLRRRRWGRAFWVLLVLALLGGTGMQAYLLANSQARDGAAAITIIAGPRTQGDSSAGAQPDTTREDRYPPATGPAVVSHATRRFLTYDGASALYGYADETGAFVIEPRFERAGQFVEGLAPVQVQGDSSSAGYGYIDPTGTIVIEPQFRTASEFSEGVARVEMVINGLRRYGFIDRSGTVVIEPRYAAAWDFSQGLARVVLTDAYAWLGYGFIDQTGALVIGPRFDSARDFAEGLAAVAIDGEWGYIDRTGAWVIEPRFPHAMSFVASGLAAVDLEDAGTAANEGARADDGDVGLHQALIDKTGKVVWERQEEHRP